MTSRTRLISVVGAVGLFVTGCGVSDDEAGSEETVMGETNEAALFANVKKRIRNVGTGRCLEARGSSVVMVACSSATAQVVTPVSSPSKCWDPYSAPSPIVYPSGMQALRFGNGMFLSAPNRLSGAVTAVSAGSAPMDSDSLLHDGHHRCNHLWSYGSVSKTLRGSTVWGAPIKVSACITDNGGVSPVMAACATTSSRQKWTQF
jgi:hypothetical protein